jgi:hypothetical protein
MLVKRQKTLSSFGPDGRRVDGTACTAITAARNSSNRLFCPEQKLQIQRAPIMNGLTCAGSFLKKFQRPMLKRRAYKGAADEALKHCSLGPKKRLDGMAKLMARAGRGLHFSLQKKKDTDENADSTGESSEDEEEDRPFEPLMLWKSPHQGGEAKGLPSQM